jgi:hypothetical protein|tara:strand:- start:3943 stop:4227 length:285 start_codon:yes stop_codon:yes gene_type:complete
MYDHDFDNMDNRELFIHIMTHDVVLALIEDKNGTVSPTCIVNSTAKDTKTEEIIMGVLDLLKNDLDFLWKRGREVIKEQNCTFEENVPPFWKLN